MWDNYKNNGGYIMTINELCKIARLESNIKAIEVARRLGLPRSNITMFEKGKTRSGKILTWYLINTNLVEHIARGELDE